MFVGRRGGGALVFVQDGLHFSRRPDLEHWDEDIWIELTPSGMGNRRLLFGCFYRPPSSDIDRFCSTLESSFSHLDLQRADVFLLGDFNATSPSWLSSDDYNSAGTVLQPLFLQLSLQQLMSSATRFQTSQSSGREPRDSLLDLVLTSNAALVSSTSVLPPIGSSDHAAVRCALQLSTRSSPAQSRLTRIWVYEKADLRELNNVLDSSDWSPVATAPSVDAAWLAWKSIFLDKVNKHVPSKVVSRLKRKQPWITADLEKVIREKHQAFRRFKRSPSPDSRAVFVSLRNRVTKLIRKAQRTYTESLHRSARLSHSPAAVQRFWQCMKLITGRTKDNLVPDLLSTDGRSASSDLEKANVLNSFFASQTLLPGRDKDVPSLPPAPDDACFAELSTTPASVYKALSTLKVGKAPGNDGIHPGLLRLCARGICNSVALLFNRSFREGVFPAEWKEAIVIPVFKKGSKADPSNYRPISLLPILSKVQERLVFNELYPFLSGLLSDRQSGFGREMAPPCNLYVWFKPGLLRLTHPTMLPQYFST